MKKWLKGAAVLLAGAAMVAGPSAAAGPLFPDLQNSVYYYPVLTLHSLGIVEGVAGGTYDGAATLTLQQAGFIASRIGGEPPATYLTAQQAAHPYAGATFADVASVLLKLAGIPAGAGGAYATATGAGVLGGAGGQPGDMVTRDQAALVFEYALYNVKDRATGRLLVDDVRARTSIDTLHTVTTVASTVDAGNGDQNPYGLSIVPGTFNDANTVLKAGDLLVSNFSNAAGVNGQGTTVERIHDGQVSTFFKGAQGPVALAVSALGPPWIANLGLAADGSQGNIQVVNPNGVLFSGGTITSPKFQGPWGQLFNFGPLYHLPAAFFSTNVMTGTVDRITGFSPPNFQATSVITQIGSGLGTSGTDASNFVGPQGMAYSPIHDTLYVADPVNNRIVAYVGASTATGDLGQGTVLFQGSPLMQPAGLAINPLNGDILAVNQGNNDLVEISPEGQVVGQAVLDKTPVQSSGQGSALFGLAAAVNAKGQLVVYFTDDNTNTVDMLSR